MVTALNGSSLQLINSYHTQKITFIKNIINQLGQNINSKTIKIWKVLLIITTVKLKCDILSVMHNINAEEDCKRFSMCIIDIINILYIYI